MTYLLICDHARTIVEAIDADQARQMLPCKKCRVFDLQAEKWLYKDVRIYRATTDDVKVGSGTREPIARKRTALDQLDWIKEDLE